jgi:hypothetical protein
MEYHINRTNKRKKGGKCVVVRLLQPDVQEGEEGGADQLRSPGVEHWCGTILGRRHSGWVKQGNLKMRSVVVRPLQLGTVRRGRRSRSVEHWSGTMWYMRKEKL